MEPREIRVAIVEDEEAFSEKMASFFEEYQVNHEVCFETDKFLSPLNFLEKFKSQYDLICLDIQMPGYNGFEVAQEIRKTDKEVLIVLITSFSQYAIKGYEIQAFDYILKPFSYEEFNLKIRRIISAISQKPSLYVLDENGIRYRIQTEQVIYFEILAHEVTIYTKEGTFHRYTTLKEIEKSLPEGMFLRVKSCYLINLKYLTGMNEDNVILDGKTSLSVSRGMKKKIVEILKEKR